MSENVSAEDLIERARKLVPILRSRAEQAEELRRIPDETIHDFREAGLFKAVQPKRFGGYGLNPAVIYDLQIELGRGCVSSAWVFGVLSVHTWQLALFPAETQDEVWGPNPDALIGSSYMPVGKTSWVDGGVKLSGRWSFSSGCDHCQWTFLGGMVAPKVEGQQAEMMTFLLPRSDYQIIDNWYVSGLKATGSKDVVVEDRFVPDAHMHRFWDGFRQESPGNKANPGPEYRYPFGQIHVRSVSTPALGAAVAALEEYREYTRNRVSQATGGKSTDDPIANVAAAEASAIIDREILTLRRNFTEMWDYLQRGEAIPVERRAQFRYDSSAAVAAAVTAVDKLFTVAGGRALFRGNVLNRCFQDVHAIRAHHANGPDKPAINFGGVQFGKRTTDIFL